VRLRRALINLTLLALLALAIYGGLRIVLAWASFTPQSIAQVAQLGPSNTPTRTPFPSLTPTETLIPPIEIPTQPSHIFFRLTWVDLPSYPIDRPLMTQLTYDPEIWVLTPDQFGHTVLAHRTIPYCQIARASAGGLPPGWSAETGSKTVSGIYFETVSVSENGTLRYINYFTPGKSVVKTGFEVSFVDDREACITDAETVLASLSFIVATPTATPTETPSETPTSEFFPSPTPTP
jgi:hypothetical protein